MELTDYLAALRRDGAALAAAAGRCDLDAMVPTCPEWTVRELVRHVGGVHRWATSIVTTPRTEPFRIALGELVGTWPGDADLLGWFEEGVASLVQGLAAAPADLACWTFLKAPTPLIMWARRQAHETAMHRVDAEITSGTTLAYPAAFAADGIDELLGSFITRPGGRLRADPEVDLRVTTTDADGDWLVTIGPDAVTTGAPGEAADCTVAAAASDLYLLLWNRRAQEGLEVSGDTSILDTFLDTVHVRWA